MANVHVFTGVAPQGTLLDVVDGRKRMEDLIMGGPGNVAVICGPSGVGRIADLNAASREALGCELLRVAGEFDVVVVDTGAGISPAVMHFVGLAEDAVLVSTPNIAATLDAYGLIKVAHESRFATRFHLLVNLVDDDRQARAVQERIAECARRFLQREVRPLGHLIRDAAVEQANQRRRPLLLDQPAHPHCQTFSRLAASFQIAIAPARSAA